jgi:hypothetical protein
MLSKTKCFVAGAVALAAAAISISTQASAADLSFNYYAYGGLYEGPDNFTSGGGGNFDGYFDYTATDSQITYTFVSDTTWSPSAVSLNSNGLYITNGALITDPNVSITFVTIDPASTGLGIFNASNVTFDGHDVAVDWQNQTFLAGSKVILDINSGAVPEPATWAMMVLGFGAMGGYIRRSRRSATLATA